MAIQIDKATLQVASIAYPNAQVSQSYVTLVNWLPSESVELSQAFTQAVLARDAIGAQASQFFVTTVLGGANVSAQVSQSYVTMLWCGRTADHRVRAWTYSLDNHDFYVLQVGELETLVVDLTTGQWTKYNSPGRLIWRAILGRNWKGVGAGALNLGTTRTNIVAGDDTYGLLWFLHPRQGYDQHAVSGAELAFDRVATGGLPMRMRETMRCNEVYLLSAKGMEDLSIAAPVVTLETSDDAERTWIDQGSVSVIEGEYDAEFVWRSLGLIREPGRVFKITDNCLARVDGLDMR